MGSIDIIIPRSIVLGSAINKSQQHQEKNYWECRESNPGLLGEKQFCVIWAEVAHRTSDWEVLGLIPAGSWAFFLLSIWSEARGGATLLSFPYNMLSCEAWGKTSLKRSVWDETVVCSPYPTPQLTSIAIFCRSRISGCPTSTTARTCWRPSAAARFTHRRKSCAEIRTQDRKWTVGKNLQSNRSLVLG